MRLNIKELLDFFDDTPERGHASSIVGMIGEDLNAAVFKHFRNNKVVVLGDKVLQGTNAGQRLDRWILDGSLLYQCEIKNWSATAIGGRRLRSDATEEETKKMVSYYWEREMRNNFSAEHEHPNGVTKVLLKMKSPEEYKTLEVGPLLIYWMPISNDEKGENPLSVVSVESLNLPRSLKTEFTKLTIFSVSLYLRKLYKGGKGEKYIDLEMPHFEHRMGILGKFQSKK